MSSLADAVMNLDLGPEPTLQEKVEHAKALVDGAAAPPATAAPEPRAEAPAVAGGSPRLSMVLRKYRVVTEIEPADLAKQMGITTRQLTAFEGGKECGSDVLVRVLAWVLAAA